MADFESTLWQRFKDNDVIVFGINRQQPQDLVQSFITQNSITYPILMDINGSVYAQFKGSNSSKFAPFPRDVIIDKEGKILYYSKAYHPKAMINIISDYLNVTSVSDNKKGIITDFALYQNYPNPFNPYTKIEYEILKTTRVNLKIYNILGQEIKTLIDYEQQTGNYQIIWDGTDNYNIHVSSGIYIYKIKAGNFVQRKKMILLR